MGLNSENIALVEIGGSHDECLLTQLHALNNEGKKITLITTAELINRNPIFEDYIEDLLIVNMTGSKSLKSKEIKRVWKEIKNKETSKVIFNTAQGSRIRNICLYALFHKVEFIGIIHTTLKFQASFTQKIINWKIKKYFVLSEYLLSTIPPPKGIQVGYFYPLRYVDFEQKLAPKKGLIISIIGGVENRRKDLAGFVKLLISIKKEPISFVFLGKSDKNSSEVSDFVKLLKSENLQEKVTLFDSFVSQEQFDFHLKQSDLILPLVHPETPSADQYFKNQIAGAMSVSFAYKIPMLIQKGYSHIEEMKTASFYYDLNNFKEVLHSSIDELSLKANEMKAFEAYNKEYQEKRFIDFTFSS